MSGPAVAGASSHRGTGCANVFRGGWKPPLLAIVLLVGCAPADDSTAWDGHRTEVAPGEMAITKAIEYLLSQQSDDGGIKSDAYGVLRSGAATTALALYAISHAPEEQVAPQREKLDRAYGFLKRGIDKTGTVAAPDGTLDYPTYGSAMLLIAADRLKLKMSAEDKAKLTDWIIKAQLTERHDIKPDSIQYGGWDLEATSGAGGDQLKGSNISITSFALEALQGSMHKEAPAAIERAKAWVARSQNDDGGFVFHVWRRHPGNKAMWNDEAQDDAIAYATPTCDGLRCWMYCRGDVEDERVVAASRWLGRHPDVKFVPGFEAKAKEFGWREGLRFYYYFTQAKALPYLPKAEAKRRADAIQKLLLAEQLANGSFKNEQPRMFEDDPVLATSLALIALSETSDVQP